MWTSELSSVQSAGGDGWGSEEVLLFAICVAASAVGFRALMDAFPTCFQRGNKRSQQTTVSKVSAMATYGSTQVSIQPGQQPSIVVTQEPSAASVPQEDERPAAADQVAEIREVDAETTSRVEKGKQAKEAKRKKKLEQKKPEASNQEDGDLLLGEGDDVGVRDMVENDELSELLSSPEDLHGLSGKLQARLGGSDEGMCFDPKSVSWKGNESDLDAFDDSEVPASDAGELCASREAARVNSGDEFALSAADEEALRSAARESDELQDWYRDGTAPWSDAEAQPLPAASEGQ